MQSSINPKYEELEDGTLVQEYFDSFLKPVKDHYESKAIEILKLDKPHYYSLINTLRNYYPDLINKKYSKIYAFGGGHPKFESFLNSDNIVVFDGVCSIYLQFEEIFRELYNYHRKLEFIETIITPSTYKQVQLKKDKPVLFTFIHFLEHQTLENHVQLLKDLPQGIDVLIYGPNVEAARDKYWFHFRPNDHNTFIPLKTQVKILESLGYNILYSLSYSDDLLIYFRT